jgi:hypothetical protein
LRYEVHRARRRLRVEKGRQRRRAERLRLLFPLDRIGDRQIVLLDSEQLFERVADPLSLKAFPARSLERVG